MLDIQFIRDNTETVKKASQDKNVDVDIDKLIELDKKRRDLQAQTDSLREQRNSLAAETKGGKPSLKQVEKGRQLKNELAKLEDELASIEEDYSRLMLLVPNPAHESVPVGDDEADNEVLRTWGEKPDFDFEPKDHEYLGRNLDLIDLESAANASGSRFSYLKNEAVLLEFALVQWLLSKFTVKGFTPVITPQLVKEHMMVSTGFFPADKNEIYNVNPDDDNLFLIGTSEVPLAGLHMLKPLAEKDLPKRYIGFSTCFRREAGSYGKDTKGIFRVHQFDKLEMYSFTHPNKSWEEHEFLLSIEEEIMQELELHYQLVNICTGDLGAPAVKKYDIEAWIPSQGRYRELTSCSNTTDYQARRGGIKFKDRDGSRLVHTLNGTAMASTRMLMAIMENYQTADGRIRVPQVLKPYLNKEMI